MVRTTIIVAVTARCSWPNLKERVMLGKSIEAIVLIRTDGNYPHHPNTEAFQ